MDNRFGTLRWIVPLVIGVIGFAACLYAVVALQRSGWDLIVITALSAGFVGAGIFDKIEVTAKGLIIKSAQASLQSIRDIEAVVQKNQDAVRALAERVDGIAKLTAEMTRLPQTPAALTARGAALSTESIDLATSLQALGTTVRTAVDSASAAKEALGQLLDYVGWNNKGGGGS